MFDSRTYHRGLGNEAKEGRPELIFCYDYATHPPPGCGGMELRAHAMLATFLNIASAGWIVRRIVGEGRLTATVSQE